MGRPAKHDAETLLDAAAAIVAEEGPAAVTMVAVARRAAVPSGSLYHRFPSRAALLGALWLRTLERFQSGWLEALRDDDPLTAVVAAARHVVAWSRRHRDDARLLLYGADEFAQAEWPPATGRAIERQQGDAEAALRSVAGALGGGRETLERAVLAAVDVPYAVVRRRLRAGDPLPLRTEAQVEACARALLDVSSSPPRASRRRPHAAGRSSS
jgi:AcrR family transcriptional regulator